MLSMSAPAQQSAMVFTGVFVVIWVGAAVVTINAQLLGSTMYAALRSILLSLSTASLSCLVVSN